MFGDYRTHVVAACISRRRRGYCYKRCVLRRREEGGRYFQGVLCSNVHHVIRRRPGFCAPLPIVALVSRACRRSHEYSGDPFDPRRLLTVALRQLQLTNCPVVLKCQRAAFCDLANCETWYSKTRGGIGSIIRPAAPHPKESWRRRGAIQLASRTAHTRRQRNSTDRRLWHSLSVPAAPVRGTNHDV